jgi:hypothetical protein
MTKQQQIVTGLIVVGAIVAVACVVNKKKKEAVAPAPAPAAGSSTSKGALMTFMQSASDSGSGTPKGSSVLSTVGPGT